MIEVGGLLAMAGEISMLSSIILLNIDNSKKIEIIVLLVLGIGLFSMGIFYEEDHYVKDEIYLTQTNCKVQDNTNHSHWCEVPCINNFNEIIKQGIKYSQTAEKETKE